MQELKVNVDAERLAKYAQLLEQLPNRLRIGAPLSNERLGEALEEMTRQCKGRVLYTTHVVEGGKLRCDYTGPRNLLHLRVKTDDTPQDDGCIGAMLQSGGLYRVCNRVTDRSTFPEYIDAAPDHTKAELILRVPAIETVKPLRVINLESDNADAFDHVDAIAFSTLAYWIAFIDQASTSKIAEAKLLDAFTKAIDRSTELPFNRSDGFELLTKAAHALVPYDALAVVSLIRSETDGNPASLHVDFQRGYDADRLTTAGFDLNPRSFSRSVMNAWTTLTDNIQESGDRYQVRKYRPKTTYIIGTPLTYSAPSSDTSLLVVEFDQMPLDSVVVKSSVEALGKLYGLLFRQAEQSESRDLLSRAVDLLPKVITFDIGSTVARYLEFGLRTLSDRLHSTGCAFYEIVQGGTAKNDILEHAFYRREGEPTEPNASLAGETQ